MPSLSAKLKRLLDNIALADAGEMLSPREKMRLLDIMIPPENRAPQQMAAGNAASDRSTAASARTVVPQRRSVALGVGATLSLPALDYAAGACARLDAGLILLCTDAALALRLIQPHLLRLTTMGVASRIVALSDPLPGAVAEFMRNDPTVLFAVTAGDDPVASLVQHAGKGMHKAPPAPIVMVSDASPERAEMLDVRHLKRGAIRH